MFFFCLADDVLFDLSVPDYTNSSFPIQSGSGSGSGGTTINNQHHVPQEPKKYTLQRRRTVSRGVERIQEFRDNIMLLKISSVLKEKYYFYRKLIK
jgi:hypothetical protein